MLESATATWPEAARHIARRPLAILAFGAQEQHGPHLPLSTDTVIAAELARRLAEALDAVLLPPIPYGETWSTSGYAGTVSISFDTVRALLLDIGRSLRAQGVEALIVVNGHFGNRAPLELAARTLRTDAALRVLLLDYPGSRRWRVRCANPARRRPPSTMPTRWKPPWCWPACPAPCTWSAPCANIPAFPSPLALNPCGWIPFAAAVCLAIRCRRRPKRVNGCLPG